MVNRLTFGTNCSDFCYFHLQEINYHRNKKFQSIQPQISQPKLGQIGHVGGVLETSGPADSKSVPGFENRPRFVGVIEQNKNITDFFPLLYINTILSGSKPSMNKIMKGSKKTLAVKKRKKDQF